MHAGLGLEEGRFVRAVVTQQAVKFVRPHIEEYMSQQDHKTRKGRANAYRLATYRQQITQGVYGLETVPDGGSRADPVLLGQFIERQ